MNTSNREHPTNQPTAGNEQRVRNNNIIIVIVCMAGWEFCGWWWRIHRQLRSRSSIRWLRLCSLSDPHRACTLGKTDTKHQAAHTHTHFHIQIQQSPFIARKSNAPPTKLVCNIGHKVLGVFMSQVGITVPVSLYVRICCLYLDISKNKAQDRHHYLGNYEPLSDCVREFP